MANYKKASVIVLANATGSQTLTNAGSGAKLLWTEVADQTNYAVANHHLNNSTFTAPYAGFYDITLTLFFGYSVTLTAGFVSVVKNGNLGTGISLLYGPAAQGAVQTGRRMLKLAKGDTIDFYCSQTSGADIIPQSLNTTLSIVRVGNAS